MYNVCSKVEDRTNKDILYNLQKYKTLKIDGAINVACIAN